MVLDSEKVIKEMFSDNINGHHSLKKLHYFSFGSVRFYVICVMFLPVIFSGKENSCLSSPNSGILLTTAEYPAEMVDARLFKTLQRLESNCFQTEIFTEKLIRVSEIWRKGAWLTAENRAHYQSNLQWAQREVLLILERMYLKRPRNGLRSNDMFEVKS